jgi:hypothetical protein
MSPRQNAASRLVRRSSTSPRASSYAAACFSQSRWRRSPSIVAPVALRVFLDVTTATMTEPPMPAIALAVAIHAASTRGDMRAGYARFALHVRGFGGARRAPALFACRPLP